MQYMLLLKGLTVVCESLKGHPSKEGAVHAEGHLVGVVSSGGP